MFLLINQKHSEKLTTLILLNMCFKNTSGDIHSSLQAPVFLFFFFLFVFFSSLTGKYLGLKNEINEEKKRKKIIL